jgi:hypothetical protein
LRHFGGRGEEEVGLNYCILYSMIVTLSGINVPMIKMIATSFADLVSYALLLHLFLHCQRIRKYEEED